MMLRAMKERWERLCLRASMRSAAEVLASSPQKFEGLYEPVLRLSEDGSRPASVMKEWCVRSAFIAPGSPLAALTGACCETAWAKKHPDRAARLLLKCIRLAGVTREALPDSGKLTVSPLQASAYRALDGHTICADEEITVITAAWYRSEQVVEHGMAGEF